VKEREEAGGCNVRKYVYYHHPFRRGNTNITSLKVSRQCPLVLLLKASCRQDKALESEKGRVFGSAFLEHPSEEKR
jgi:hypothetical protein